MLVIDADGTKRGVMQTYEALRLAQAQGLNLVEVAANSRPPVCRILDYGKYKYDQKQEAKRRKKNQVVIELKEVKFRPKVDTHDFDFKIRHVLRFLSAGDKVKCTIMFRGREMAHTEIGEQLLHRVLATLEGKVNVELAPRLEGRNMSMVLVGKPGAFPAKKPKEATSDLPAKGKGKRKGGAEEDDAEGAEVAEAPEDLPAGSEPPRPEASASADEAPSA